MKRSDLKSEFAKQDLQEASCHFECAVRAADREALDAFESLCKMAISRAIHEERLKQGFSVLSKVQEAPKP